MFYSRPQIKPLGWDLQQMPIANGSKYYDAMTTQEIPVGFRFGGGWLEVRKSEIGGTKNFSEMSNIVFLESIAPFGTTDIFAEQICDILGITVKGQKILHPDEKILASSGGGAHYMDMSGRTTYWRQDFVTQISKDLPNLTDEIQKHTDCVLAQTRTVDQGRFIKKYRTLGFLTDDDRSVLLVFGSKREDIENFLIPFDFVKNPFRFSVFLRKEGWPHRDASGKEYIEKNGATAFNQDYNVTGISDCTFSADFQTDDIYAWNIIRLIEKIIASHFSLGLEEYILNPKTLLPQSSQDFLYSNALRDWCLDGQNNYIKVSMRKYEGVDQFMGWRPARPNKSLK